MMTCVVVSPSVMSSQFCSQSSQVRSVKSGVLRLVCQSSQTHLSVKSCWSVSHVRLICQSYVVVNQSVKSNSSVKSVLQSVKSGNISQMKLSVSQSGWISHSAELKFCSHMHSAINSCRSNNFGYKIFQGSPRLKSSTSKSH